MCVLRERQYPMKTQSLNERVLPNFTGLQIGYMSNDRQNKMVGGASSGPYNLTSYTI